MSHFNTRNPIVAALTVGLLLTAMFAGCRNAEPEVTTPEKRPLEGVSLKLAIVADSPLADAIGQLRGEWSAQTGSDFTIETMTEDELLAADSLTVDAVIMPSYQLGALAERRLIAPLPNQRAIERGEAAGWGDVFELLRLRESVWGDQVMAVPFGSPVLVVYYRTDLLARLGRQPPRTWDEYQTLAEMLSRREQLGDAAPAADAPWSGAIEPLGPGWAALTFLARSAPYAKCRSNYSTLFDINTFDPLISGPPFLRALEELVAAQKSGSSDALTYDPDAARAAFWRGECGMALSWPTAAKSVAPADAPSGLQAGLAGLPGSKAAFETGTRRWTPRTEAEAYEVPLLSIAGRLGTIARASDQPEAAMQLLLWLSSDSVSQQTSAASEATTLFRKSHARAASRWVEPGISAEAAQRYATQTQATLGRQEWLAALPLPGRQRYLAALDEGVRAAVRGDQIPLEALSTVARQWREISDELGVEQQKAAYRRSLGLDSSIAPR